MKIQENFLLYTIYRGHNRRGNANKFFKENALSEQSQRLTNNASTYNKDKRRTASKAVEVLIKTANKRIGTAWRGQIVAKKFTFTRITNVEHKEQFIEGSPKEFFYFLLVFGS